MASLKFNNDVTFEKTNLQTICDVKKGKQLNKLDMVPNGQYPAYNGGVEKSGNHTDYNMEPGTAISTGGQAGYVRYINERYWSGGDNVNLINFKDNANAMYTHHYMKQKQNKLMSYAVGMAIKHISPTDIKLFPIYLPSIDEQDKVAKLLSDVDQLIELQSSKIEEYENSKKYFLQQFFDDKNPDVYFGSKDELESIKSTKIFENLFSLQMCKRIFKDETKPNGDIPFYKIGTFGKKADAYINNDLYKEYKKKYNFPSKNEVLISCSGTVGNLVKFNGEDAYFQDSNIMWFSNNEKNIINDYLYHALSTENWAKQNSSTITRIYKDDLESKKISYPPIYIQSSISNILSSIDNSIDNEKQNLDELKSMKKSMLQNFFN